MTFSRPAPLNIAAMIPALPEVVLPNGRTVQLKPFTADAYTKFLYVQSEARDAGAGANIDEISLAGLIDEILAAVLPDATADDLASFGVRADLKMSVIAAAAGAVDGTLRRLADNTPPVDEGNVKAPPRSHRETRSVAPARGTPKRSRKTG